MPADPVIACVAVRMHSTRLPRKAFADVVGKPLLRRLIDRLRLARQLDAIVICTSTHPDDGVLLSFARDEGLDAIAGDERDVLSRFIEAAGRRQAAAVVRVTGDNVLTDPESIDLMVHRFRETRADYTRTQGMPLGAGAEVLSAAMLPRLHAAMPDPAESEYMMLYAFDPDRFRCDVLDAAEELRRPEYSLSVDTPADLDLVRRIYATLAPGGDEPALRDVVRYLDSAPGVTRVDAESPIRLPQGRTTTFAKLLADLDHRAARARALRASL